MKKSIAVLVVSLLISVPLSAHAFPTKKGDKACTECHKLSKQEAEEIVKKIAPEREGHRCQGCARSRPCGRSK